MTNQEMTELFSIMLLAWPNAEMFKGGTSKLGPTIELWTTCTKDVDFWTGQQAVVMLCKSCKFPPTIAEFRQQADEVNARIKNCISRDWDSLRFYLSKHRRKNNTPEILIRRWYEALPLGFARSAVDQMGGPNKLLDGECLNYWAFDTAYRTVMRGKTALPAGQKRLR